MYKEFFQYRDIYSRDDYPYGQIAIARDFALVAIDGRVIKISSEGEHELQMPGYPIKLAAGFDGYMALQRNGNVYTGGRAREFERYRDVQSLRSVYDIVACEGHTAGILDNGDLFCFDEPGGWEGVPQLEKVVTAWQGKGIRKLAIGFSNVMGLTQNGNVFYYGLDGFTDNHFYDTARNVTEIDAYSHYYGDNYSMALLRDGRVITDSFDGTDTWENIIHISVGADIAIGLKVDGTIFMVDNRGTRTDALNWRNLIAVECKFFSVIGITSDGEILKVLG